MSDIHTNKVSGVRGVVGEVYAGPTTSLFIESFEEDDAIDNGIKEHTEGWMQTTPNERVRVVRRRISHSMCVWSEVRTTVDNDDLPAGMAH